MRQKTENEDSINEPYKLPDGWRWVRLGEVCKVFSGSPAPQNPKYFENGKYPFVRVQDVGRYGRTTALVEIKDYINDSALKELSLVKAEKGTILFPKSGAAITTNNRAILGIDAFIVSHLAALKPKEGAADTHFVYYWSCLTDMVQYMENLGYPSLKLSVVSKITIPLPPLSEQRRIASKIQEIMQEVERAQTACKKQLEAAKLLPSAYLREVFESKEAKKWERKRLGEVCEFGSGKFIQKEKVKNKGAYPVYGANGIIGFTEEKLFDKEMIVIGRVGSCGVVNKTLGPAWITDNTIILQHVNQTTFDFLYWVLKSLKLEETKAASVQPLITQKDLKSILIPLPPIDLQRRIAADLTEKMAYVEKLCTAIENQLEAINALPQVILRKAFRGEL